MSLALALAPRRRHSLAPSRSTARRSLAAAWRGASGLGRHAGAVPDSDDDRAAAVAGGIAASRIESPSTTLGVVGRMALEVFLFRSLFRNTASARRGWSGRGSAPGLPGAQGALARRDGVPLVAARHRRPPSPAVRRSGSARRRRAGRARRVLRGRDRPTWYATDVVVVVALGYLLVRRLRDPLLRYLTLPADYLALAALLAVVGTGIAAALRRADRPRRRSRLHAGPGGVRARPRCRRLAPGWPLTCCRCRSCWPSCRSPR